MWRRVTMPGEMTLPRGAVPPSEDVEGLVRRVLSSLGANHQLIACDPDFADTVRFCAHYGLDPWDSANTILVASRTEPRRFCACVALAPTRIDVNHRVCELMGVRRASFASAGDTERITGMMIGGVTPFGLPDSLPLYIDSRVLGRESVVVGGGSRSLKVRIAPGRLAELPGARTIHGLARLPDPGAPPAP